MSISCIFVEAFEPCTVVIVYEGGDEVVSLLVCVEAVTSGIAAISRVAAQGL
ncbi:MAG: hypothetical protein MRY64_13250 [Hyphomonadaceae bacterium]|nr:hypothetical protein [Hyphomonadaceae bacterium]